MNNILISYHHQIPRLLLLLLLLMLSLFEVKMEIFTTTSANEIVESILTRNIEYTSLPPLAPKRLRNLIGEALTLSKAMEIGNKIWDFVAISNTTTTTNESMNSTIDDDSRAETNNFAKLGNVKNKIAHTWNQKLTRSQRVMIISSLPVSIVVFGGCKLFKSLEENMNFNADGADGDDGDNFDDNNNKVAKYLERFNRIKQKLRGGGNRDKLRQTLEPELIRNSTITATDIYDYYHNIWREYCRLITAGIIVFSIMIVLICWFLFFRDNQNELQINVAAAPNVETQDKNYAENLDNYYDNYAAAAVANYNNYNRMAKKVVKRSRNQKRKRRKKRAPQMDETSAAATATKTDNDNNYYNNTDSDDTDDYDNPPPPSSPAKKQITAAAANRMKKNCAKKKIKKFDQNTSAAAAAADPIGGVELAAESGSAISIGGKSSNLRGGSTKATGNIVGLTKSNISGANNNNNNNIISTLSATRVKGEGGGGGW